MTLIFESKSNLRPEYKYQSQTCNLYTFTWGVIFGGWLSGWSRVVPGGPWVGTGLTKIMTILWLILCVYTPCRLRARWPVADIHRIRSLLCRSCACVGYTRTCRLITAAGHNVVGAGCGGGGMLCESFDSSRLGIESLKRDRYPTAVAYIRTWVQNLAC